MLRSPDKETRVTDARRGARAPGRVLLVEDDRPLREMLSEFLSGLGHEVDAVGTLDAARGRLRARSHDLVLTDLILERGTGLDLLHEVRERDLPVEVVIMTGHGNVETAVQAIRDGAYDFLTKPVDLRRLEFAVLKALEKRRLEDHLRRLEASSRDRFGELVGVSAPMRAVFGLLDRAARSDVDVLLVGPTGSGKELAARAIHERSRRSAGPFLPVHCGALAPELLESELYGHVRGAFTGAERSRDGLFVRARGGTVLLDEIGAAPERVQVGLLRVLQERTVRPIGSTEDVPVDVRVIAATHADLDARIERGEFRQDLYYRLAALVIELPPLAARREDLPVLAAEILGRLAARHGRVVRLAPRALERLAHHDWPGNVRELEHVLEQALLACRGGVIRARDLPLPADDGSAVRTLEEVEREHVRHVLERCGGNKLRAARLLGVPRATLYRKLVRWGLEPAAPSAPRAPDVPPDDRPRPAAPAGLGPDEPA
ncbi:MAG: sigma-54 dependent transcriptional regulator [Acidobacteriota bacterium]